MKTKFRIDILQQGEELNELTRAIASHNSGKIPISLDDILSYGQMIRAIFPISKEGFCIQKDEGDGSKLLVSHDEGKTTSFIIEEIEVNELILD